MWSYIPIAALIVGFFLFVLLFGCGCTNRLRYKRNDKSLFEDPLWSVHFINEKNQRVNLQNDKEKREDVKWIPKDACVLEVGARYGTMSVAINRHLDTSMKHVAIEADPAVWSALERNKKTAQARFHIIKGAISDKPLVLKAKSNGVRTSHSTTRSVPIFSYDQIKKLSKLDFDTLVVDCEGCVLHLIKTYPAILEDMTWILIEFDVPDHCTSGTSPATDCNYDEVKKLFDAKGFKCVKPGFHSVYYKEPVIMDENEPDQ